MTGEVKLAGKKSLHVGAYLVFKHYNLSSFVCLGYMFQTQVGIKQVCGSENCFTIELFKDTKRDAIYSWCLLWVDVIVNCTCNLHWCEWSNNFVRFIYNCRVKIRLDVIWLEDCRKMSGK